MKHELLDPHDIIAWDMDETLVNGPNSDFFRAYIKTNPKKQHHIITFRTGVAWVDGIRSELAPHGIRTEHIVAVHGVPADLYFAYAQRQSLPMPDKVQAYREFKARKAMEIGATILVDDMEALVRPTCEAFGIEFVNALGEFPRVHSVPLDREPMMDEG